MVMQTIGWILLIIIIGIGIFYLGLTIGAAKVAEVLVRVSKNELMKLKEDIDKVRDGAETMREFKEKYDNLKLQNKN